MTKYFWGIFLLAGGFPSTIVLAETTETENQQLAVDVYYPPVALNLPHPIYPLRALQDGIEGWVRVHYMVDPAGNTYDIEVVDSSGHGSIERAGLKAAKKYKYLPARFKNHTIDAGAAMTVSFQIGDRRNARSRKFGFVFRQFRAAAKEDDQAAMQDCLSRLNKLKTNTLFEHFATLVMQGFYAESKNDPEAVRQAYGSALSLDSRHGFFSKKDQRRDLLLTLMQAEITTGHLRAALATWEELAPALANQQLRGHLAEQVAEIERVIAGDNATSVKGTIDAGYGFTYKLAKPSFALSNVAGRLAEAKLHCQRGSVAFAVSENTAYTIKKDLGACTLILVGDPDTAFEIIDGA
jgi:TonB family protein